MRYRLYIFCQVCVWAASLIHSSMNFTMQKMKPVTPTEKTVKYNVETTVTGLVPVTMHFLWSGITAYWKRFLFNVLAMVKKLGTPTYFLTLPCADLRWEKLSYIINKSNNNIHAIYWKITQYLLLDLFIKKFKRIFEEIALDSTLRKTTHWISRTQ